MALCPPLPRRSRGAL